MIGLAQAIKGWMRVQRSYVMQKQNVAGRYYKIRHKEKKKYNIEKL